MKYIFCFLLGLAPFFSFSQGKEKKSLPPYFGGVETRVVFSPKSLFVLDGEIGINYMKGISFGLASVFEANFGERDLMNARLFIGKKFFISKKRNATFDFRFQAGFETSEHEGGLEEILCFQGEIEDKEFEYLFYYQRLWFARHNFYFRTHFLIPVKDFQNCDLWAGGYAEEDILIGPMMEVRFKKLPISFSLVFPGWDYQEGELGGIFRISYEL